MSIWTDFRTDLEELERQKRERALRAINKVPLPPIVDSSEKFGVADSLACDTSHGSEQSEEITWKDVLWFFTKVLFWASVIVVLVIGWLSL
jgi:hypothetical protein